MAGEKFQVSAATVRAWARRKGLQVGERGHLPKSVISAFNRAHRTKVFTNSNPWLKSKAAA